MKPTRVEVTRGHWTAGDKDRRSAACLAIRETIDPTARVFFRLDGLTVIAPDGRRFRVPQTLVHWIERGECGVAGFTPIAFTVRPIEAAGMIPRP